MIVERNGAKQKEFVHDEIIEDIIKSNDGEDYSSFLKGECAWNVFYHLSPMRQSLLNWYDFGRESLALEVSGEYGALTGVLCDQCKEVITLAPNRRVAEILQKRYENRENLMIYVGELGSIDLPHRFDFIVDLCGIEQAGGIGQGEKAYENYLKLLDGYLKDNGKIILTADNRYGVRYFCGAKEKYSQLPFAGINQYFEEQNGHLFHRQELEQILIASGLNQYKFYYPLPDYIVPQVVFTDQRDSSILVSERLNPYNVDQSTLVACERKLYRDIIDNGVLKFFSNSFLVECGKQHNMCDIISAVLSTDRARTDSYATCLKEGGKVSKRNLFPEGKQRLQTLCHNIWNIAGRGIKTIPHQFIDGQIIMPYMNAPTLSNVLANAAAGDSEKFVQLWDRLYQLILKSSELVPDAKEEILREAYIDLVPSNIFVLDDEFYVYDQEFVWENCPAKFVLYRGIKYTYMVLDGMETEVSLEEMKKHFGLEENWDDYEKMENEFILYNRQGELYRQFNTWADSNRWIIAKRGERIGEIVV